MSGIAFLKGGMILERCITARLLRRLISAVCVFLLLSGSAAYAGPGDAASLNVSGTAGSTAELRGVWFSYLDWNAMPADEAGFKKAADQMMDRVRANGMNAIFVHAHSHSDSYYSKTSLFPRSLFVTTKAAAPAFDAFQYMIDAAHKRGIQFHAWFNPYRVTGYLMSWDKVPEDSPAKIWYKNSAARRNVLFHDGQYYLNPSMPAVQDAVVGAVTELVQNYNVDGVQFDDYFYPALDDGNPDRSFDKAEYLASGSALPIAAWRRNNVSELVRRVHFAIKTNRPSCTFGISPVANLTTLRKDTSMFVDIDRWMSSGDYIDYVMPQIYFGFEAKTSQGVLAEHSYEKCMNSWIALRKKGPVKLMIGLGLYRAGTAVWDGNTISEWLRYDDIIARQVLSARKTGAVSGFGFYAYSSFSQEPAQKELANLRKVLN